MEAISSVCCNISTPLSIEHRRNLTVSYFLENTFRSRKMGLMFSGGHDPAAFVGYVQITYCFV